MKRVFAVFTALAVLTSSLAAQHPAPDSLAGRREPARPVIRLWEAGLLAGLTGGAMAIDQSVRRHIQDGRGKVGDGLADVGNVFGSAEIVYPVLLAGTLGGKAFGSKGLEGVSWRAFESSAIAGVGDLALKSLVGRKRPDISPDDAFTFRPLKFKDNSFPSGHTAVAFALATSFAHETRDHLSDGVFYGLATLTAFSRINDDRHWLSDTIFGAGVGIMSARLVQRMHRKLILGPGVVGANLSF